MRHYYLRYKYQKNRSFIRWKRPNLVFGNSALFCLSSGFLSLNTMDRLCIVFRKRLKFKKSLTRYWVRHVYNYIQTKKGINTRMGKGKGSIKTYCSLLHSGNTLVEFLNIRGGLLRKLFQYTKVRCSFKLGFIQRISRSISIGSNILKNCFLKKNFFKKKKTFPTLRKNFKFIIFKLSLKDRLNDMRLVESIYTEITEVYSISAKYLYIDKSFCKYHYPIKRSYNWNFVKIFDYFLLDIRTRLESIVMLYYYFFLNFIMNITFFFLYNSVKLVLRQKKIIKNKIFYKKRLKRYICSLAIPKQVAIKKQVKKKKQRTITIV